MTFEELGVAEPIVRELASQGIVEPLPIQAATIADALAGRDVCGRAVTGSGKSLAFGIPVLQRAHPSKPARPVALILAPTRELALQVTKVLIPLSRTVGLRTVAVYGGAPIVRQIQDLKRGCEIVVATPGRLLDLIERRKIYLRTVETVVLDEADQMADLGFTPQVRAVLDEIGGDHQTLLFSATLDGDVDALIRDYLRDPVRHDVEPPASHPLVHRFFTMRFHEKVPVTAAIARGAERTLVFVRTRRAADEIASELSKLAVPALPMHGDLKQPARERALQRFRSGETRVLVATDVAARGLHVEGVDVVVHFDPPDDDKAYLHRSGRTARAGAAGVAVSLLLKKHVAASKLMQKRLGIDEPTLHANPADPTLGTIGTRDSTPSLPPPTPSPADVLHAPGHLPARLSTLRAEQRTQRRPPQDRAVGNASEHPRKRPRRKPRRD